MRRDRPRSGAWSRAALKTKIVVMMSKLVGRGDDRRSRALDEWDLLRREFRKRHTTVGGLDLGDWSGEMLRQEEAEIMARLAELEAEEEEQERLEEEAKAEAAAAFAAQQERAMRERAAAAAAAEKERVAALYEGTGEEHDAATALQARFRGNKARSGADGYAWALMHRDAAAHQKVAQKEEMEALFAKETALKEQGEADEARAKLAKEQREAEEATANATKERDEATAAKELAIKEQAEADDAAKRMAKE